MAKKYSVDIEVTIRTTVEVMSESEDDDDIEVALDKNMDYVKEVLRNDVADLDSFELDINNIEEIEDEPNSL